MASTLPSHSWSRAPGCHFGERLRGSRRGGGATCWLFGSELKLFRHLERFYPIGGRGDSIWREQVATLFPNTLTDFIQKFWHFLFPNIFGNNSCEHNWGYRDKSYQINHLKCSLGHTWKLTIVVFTGGYYLSKRYIDWQKSVFIGRTNLAVGKSHITHNSLQYVALDCVKDISHKVSVSSCGFKCSYFPLSTGFILRLKPIPNVVPEKIDIRNDANVKAHNYESVLKQGKRWSQNCVLLIIWLSGTEKGSWLQQLPIK